MNGKHGGRNLDSPENTERLHESIRQSLSGVFAGRGQELDRLRNYLESARQGRGHFVVITGEQGTGKTTLLKNFRAQAEADGARTITLNFDDFPAFEPYAPFLRVIGSLNDAAADDKMAIGKGRKGGPDDSGLESFHSLQAHQVLVQQRLIARILAAAREEVLVISMFETQKGCLSTWRFIHYVCEAIRDRSILLLAHLRPAGESESASQPPVYLDVMQRLSREGMLEKIVIGRFSEGEMNQVLHEVFARRDFSGRFTSRLYELTAGNPLQVRKCLEKMVEAGLIFEQNGVWFDSPTVSKELLLELISDKDDVEKSRKILAGLPENLKQLLEYTALMEGAVSHKILSTITGQSGVRVLKDLIVLKERHLLNADAGERYMISRPEIRSAILDGISDEEKRRLHLMIAVGIEADDQIDPTERIYQLAHHYSRTDNHDMAFRHLRQAGEIAARNFAFLEAMDLFKQAFDHHSQVPKSVDRRESIQTMIWMAWLDRVIGNWEQSLARYNGALEICDDQDVGLRKHILLQQGLSYFRLSDWEHASRCFKKCLNNEQSPSKLDRAMANYGLGNIHFELGEYETCVKYYNVALSLADGPEAQQLRANIFNNLGAVENIRGRHIKAISLYSKSIPVFKSLGDNFGLARVYNNIGMTHADEGKWEYANEFYSQSLKFSDVMGLVPLKSITFLNRAMALTHLRRFEEAREYNFKAYRILDHLKDELGIAEYYRIQGVIECREGNYDQAEKHLQNALEKYAAADGRLGYAESEVELGRLASAMNDHAAAISWFEKALVSFGNLKLTSKSQIIQAELNNLKARPAETGVVNDKKETVT